MGEFSSFSINSTEMDFITAIEDGYNLPIAFRNRAALDRWAGREAALEPIALGRRDEFADVLLLQGLINPYTSADDGTVQGLVYRQVWARVDYRRHREAMMFRVMSSRGKDELFSLYDSDHSVSQDRLAKLWPGAWVNILFVERGINRAIGSMLEKEPLEISEGADRITINAESVLKTFCDRGGEAMTFDRRREYLARARQRFIVFRNQLRERPDDVEMKPMERLSELVASENAWEFFDEFARMLDVAPLDRPPTPALVFRRRECTTPGQ